MSDTSEYIPDPNANNPPERKPGPVQSRSRGWFKASRFPEMPKLIKSNRNAFLLAYLIAYRANWSEGFNAWGFALGEAAIDYEAWGLTRQEFRTARRFLEKRGFATFRGTKRGTIGMLTDNRLFEVLPAKASQRSNQQPTNSQPTVNHQPTSNEEREDRKQPCKSERANEVRDRDKRRVAALTGKITPELDALRHDTDGPEGLERLCELVLGRDEMVRCGRRWRERAQEEPDKLKRVLGEMIEKQKQGEAVRNPGAYAEDLWQRFK